METPVPAPSAPQVAPFAKILETAKSVILNPVGFYRSMPKSGGLAEPLIFVVVLAVATGLIRAVFGLFHVGVAVSVLAAIGSIVLVPVFFVIGSFIGAAILFVIWKLMGSKESFETAYRSAAYMSAISPITTVLGLIPFVGALIAMAWGLYLVVTASVEVHGIKAKTAWLVFGILAAIFALMNVSAQVKMRRFARSMEGLSRSMGGESGEEMTPEQAGEQFAKFMKGVQEESARQSGKKNRDRDEE
jgi:hypothetical protein